jgi:uncharacterized protein YlxW (UPF0749 family)
MSASPSAAAPEPKASDNVSDEGKLVRQLIIAVILSIATSLTGVGVAATRGDVSPEVRVILDDIRISLTKLEARLNTSDRDVGRLEGRVEKLESTVQDLQRKVK